VTSTKPSRKCFPNGLADGPASHDETRTAPESSRLPPKRNDDQPAQRENGCTACLPARTSSSRDNKKT